MTARPSFQGLSRCRQEYPTGYHGLYLQGRLQEGDIQMATVNLTAESFNEVVSLNDTVLVDFWG
ncbi:MAG: hypothetical protein ABSD85_07240, partial [Acidimicrobiales bacterium]